MLTIFVFFNKEVCKWPSHEPFDRNWSSLASLQLGVQKLFNNFEKNIYVIFFAFWNPCESVGWCNNELTDIFSQSNDGIICEHFKQCFWHYLSVFSTRNQNHIWITTGALGFACYREFFLEYPFLHCVIIMMKLKLFRLFFDKIAS